MRYLISLLMFVPFVALAQAVDTTASEHEAVADSGGVRIVVLGSSTAEGIGPDSPDSAWVSRYRRHLQAMNPQHEVINLAKGGYTTYHLLPTGTQPPGGRPQPDPEWNITHALALVPDAIIINLPSNDAARGYAVEEQLANYDVMLEAAEAKGVPVWIATTQPRNLDGAGRRAQVAMRDSTFARFAPRAIDFWTGLAEDDATIKPAYDSGDGVHLNNRAHALLFQRVAEAGVPKEAAAAAAQKGVGKRARGAEEERRGGVEWEVCVGEAFSSRFKAPHPAVERGREHLVCGH